MTKTQGFIIISIIYYDLLLLLIIFLHSYIGQIAKCCISAKITFSKKVHFYFLEALKFFTVLLKTKNLSNRLDKIIKRGIVKINSID